MLKRNSFQLRRLHCLSLSLCHSVCLPCVPFVFCQCISTVAGDSMKSIWPAKGCSFTLPIICRYTKIDKHTQRQTHTDRHIHRQAHTHTHRQRHNSFGISRSAKVLATFLWYTTPYIVPPSLCVASLSGPPLSPLSPRYLPVPPYCLMLSSLRQLFCHFTWIAGRSHVSVSVSLAVAMDVNVSVAVAVSPPGIAVA